APRGGLWHAAQKTHRARRALRPAWHRPQGPGDPALLQPKGPGAVRELAIGTTWCVSTYLQTIPSDSQGSPMKRFLLILAVLVAGCDRQSPEESAPPPPNVTVRPPIARQLVDMAE